VKINPLDILFNPDSIAVVGASRNPSTPNYNLLANLVRLKFQGRLYPVNPNVQEIDGMKSYPSLKSIEDEIDMVVSSVPAAATPDVIKDCVEKKVKVVVQGKCQGKLLNDFASEVAIISSKQFQSQQLHSIGRSKTSYLGPLVYIDKPVGS
jgi:predicted CoA-binding protein